MYYLIEKEMRKKLQETNSFAFIGPNKSKSLADN